MVDTAVVAEDEHDRVVEQLFLFQFRHNAHAAVHVEFRYCAHSSFEVLCRGNRPAARPTRFHTALPPPAPPLDALGAVAEIINVVLGFRRVHLQEKRPALFDDLPVGALKDFILDKIQPAYLPTTCLPIFSMELRESASFSRCVNGFTPSGRRKPSSR